MITSNIPPEIAYGDDHSFFDRWLGCIEQTKKTRKERFCLLSKDVITRRVIERKECSKCSAVLQDFSICRTLKWGHHTQHLAGHFCLYLTYPLGSCWLHDPGRRFYGHPGVS
jgi:hypothetical protein